MHRLDALVSERPEALDHKKQHFFQSYEIKAATKIRNVQEELEKLRLLAEIDRVKRFRILAEKQALLYYDICLRLVEWKLDQRPSCLFIMDFLKHLLESGNQIEINEIREVIKELKVAGHMNEESIR